MHSLVLTGVQTMTAFAHPGGTLIYDLWSGGGGSAGGGGGGADCISGTMTLSARTLYVDGGAAGAGDSTPIGAGSPGGDMSLLDSDQTTILVQVPGGEGAAAHIGGPGGNGGTVTTGTSIEHPGGNGADFAGSSAGGGGGAGGTDAAGQDGSAETGGTAGAGGGDGGTGATIGNPLTNGNDPGGGGGGTLGDGTGSGGAGKAILFYNLPAPTLSNRKVLAAGNVFTATLSQSGITPTGTSGTGGFTLTCTTSTVTVTSWSIFGTILTLNLSGTIKQGETVTLAYNGSAGLTNGDNAMATFSGQSVLNNSTVPAPSSAAAPAAVLAFANFHPWILA